MSDNKRLSIRDYDDSECIWAWSPTTGCWGWEKAETFSCMYGYLPLPDKSELGPMSDCDYEALVGVRTGHKWWVLNSADVTDVIGEEDDE